MKRVLIAMLITAVMVTPVRASEIEEADPLPYTWVEEGDEKYCYVDGGWDEYHMLTGWHQIDGELFWFEDTDFSDERPIGAMARNEWVDMSDMSYHFDAYGRLDEWRELP